MTSAHAMDDLAAQLDASGAATIYVDIAGISQDTTTVSGGLSITFDQVRQLYAVRKATADEVADAESSSAEPTSTASTASTASRSSTTT